MGGTISTHSRGQKRGYNSTWKTFKVRGILEDLGNDKNIKKKKGKGKDVPVLTMIANILRVQTAPLTCNFRTR